MHKLHRWGGALMCLLLSTHALAEEASSADTNSEEAHVDDAKRSSARQLATEASSDYRAGLFQEAYDKFDRAFRLVGVPALGVWSARSLKQLNRLVEASERYRDVLKKGSKEGDPASYAQSLKDARAELDQLLPLIPDLTINLQHAQAEDIVVTIDDKAVDPALLGVKQRIDPGSHTIVGKRGKEVVREEVTLPERSTEEVTLRFRPGYLAPSPEEKERENKGITPLQSAGIASMATGGAFLITGIVTTVVALGQQEELKKVCNQGDCPPSAHDQVTNFNTMKTISMVGLVGAGVLGAAGITLYAIGTPKKEKEPNLALELRGNGAALWGTF